MRLTSHLGYGGAAALAITLAACGAVKSSGSEALMPSHTSREDDNADEYGIGSELPPDDVILQTVLNQAESLDICDGFYQPAVATSESQVYRLGDQALVELVCARAAYQLVYAYGVYQPGGTLQPLALDGFYPNQAGQFERTSEPTVGGLATFAPEQELLTVFSKARGLGDCGSLAEYRWTGSELALETFRYQECSDDLAEEFVDPINYPQIYP